MREWEIGAVENIHGALPYIRFAPILALVGVGVNRTGKDETGLTKGLVRKLNALRKSVGGELAEEVFAKWLERGAGSQAKSKPDPVAMKIVNALAGFENDPKFKLGNHGYTLRRSKGKGASGFIAYKNEKPE